MNGTPPSDGYKQTLESLLPNLSSGDYEITSEATMDYNCIAWSLEEDQKWWWPDSEEVYYWPENLPRNEELEAFIKVYEDRGYEICENHNLEQGYKKVALFADDSGIPTHAARQLPNGKWTSKLGPEVDIEHALNGVEGPTYGKVVKVLKKSI